MVRSTYAECFDGEGGENAPYFRDRSTRAECFDAEGGENAPYFREKCPDAQRRIENRSARWRRYDSLLKLQTCSKRRMAMARIVGIVGGIARSVGTRHRINADAQRTV